MSEIRRSYPARRSTLAAAAIVAASALGLSIGVAHTRVTEHEQVPSVTAQTSAAVRAFSSTSPADARVQLQACLSDARMLESTAGDGAGPTIGYDWTVTAAVTLPPTHHRAKTARHPDGKIEQLATPALVASPQMWFIAGRENGSQNVAECVVTTSPGGGYKMNNASVGPSQLQDNYLPARTVVKGVFEYGDQSGLVYGYHSSNTGLPQVEAEGVQYPTYTQDGVFIGIVPKKSPAPNQKAQAVSADPFASVSVLTVSPLGQVLSTQRERLSMLVQARPCWIKPDGTPIVARGEGQPDFGGCGTAFPPAWR